MNSNLAAIDPPKERARWAVLLSLCLFSALLGRLCYLVRPFDNDAAIFVYMGKMVAEGGRLCHDLIDNKFPTVGLMTSVLWRTLGTSWFGYVALQTILSLTSAVLLGRIAGRFIGRHAAMPAALFALVYLNFTTALYGGFRLETLQVFFDVLAVRSALIAMDGDTPADMFVAGLCAGCAAMFKPTGLGVLAAVAVALCVRFQRPQWRRVFWHLSAAAAGAAIPLGVAFAYLVGADLLADMPGLWRQISTYASQSAWTADDLIKPLIVVALIGFPILVRGWIYRRDQQTDVSWPAAYIIILALAWFAAESYGVVMQRRMYAYHFLPIVPPVALIFGLLPRVSRPIPLAAALLPMILLSIYASGDVIATTYTGEDRLPATEYLAIHAQPGDAVWTDSWPRLLLETNLRPGARLAFTFLFTNYDTAGLDYSRQMIGDFERIKPKYIFLPVPMDRRIQYQLDFIAELMRRPVRRDNYSAGWHLIQKYTLEHYDREAVVGGEVAYRRRPDIAGHHDGLANLPAGEQ